MSQQSVYLFYPLIHIRGRRVDIYRNPSEVVSKNLPITIARTQNLIEKQLTRNLQIYNKRLSKMLKGRVERTKRSLKDTKPKKARKEYANSATIMGNGVYLAPRHILTRFI